MSGLEPAAVRRVVDGALAKLKAANLHGLVEQAEALGMNRETWRKTRSGETSPQPENLRKLLEYLKGADPYADTADALRYAAQRLHELARELLEMAARGSPADDAADLLGAADLVEEAGRERGLEGPEDGVA